MSKTMVCKSIVCNNTLCKTTVCETTVARNMASPGTNEWGTFLKWRLSSLIHSFIQYRKALSPAWVSSALAGPAHSRRERWRCELSQPLYVAATPRSKTMVSCSPPPKKSSSTFGKMWYQENGRDRQIEARRGCQENDFPSPSCSDNPRHGEGNTDGSKA